MRRGRRDRNTGTASDAAVSVDNLAPWFVINICRHILEPRRGVTMRSLELWRCVAVRNSCQIRK
jgi:hypothetical protein